MRTSKKRKFIVRLLVFVLVAVIANGLCTFVLTPTASPSSEMWSKYRAREKGSLSMVYVGTSQCYEGVNPVVTDAITGKPSQNMGTNAQSFADSKRAIEAALNDHPIEHVVLFLDYMYMEEGKERYSKPESAFVYAQNKGQPLSEKIKNTAGFIFDKQYFGKPASVAFFFPWLNNLNRFPKTIPHTMKAKLGLVELESNNTNYLRTPEGFKSFDRRINFNRAARQTRAGWEKKIMSEESLNLLDSICALCKEHNARLTVLVAPVPVSATLCYGASYYKRISYVQNFFAERGVDFYDMNLAKKEFYPRGQYDFKDWDHLNTEGAYKFSRALGELVKKLQDGEDVSGLFYDRAGYEASIDYIETVNVHAWQKKDSIRLIAGSYHGSQIHPEYMFQVKGPGETQYKTLSGYSRKRRITFKPEKEGTYEIRVFARPQGKSTFDCGYVMHVSYWKH